MMGLREILLCCDPSQSLTIFERRDGIRLLGTSDQRISLNFSLLSKFVLIAISIKLDQIAYSVYMRIFLEAFAKWTMLKEDVLEFTGREGDELSRPTPAFRKMPTQIDVITLLKSR